jgi:hypothetical protein
MGVCYVCIHRSRSHILLSLETPPNLVGQDPVFISPRNRVAQLYPLVALGYVRVIDGQKWPKHVRSQLLLDGRLLLMYSCIKKCSVLRCLS